MTTISDSFVRADSASLGGDWTEAAGDASIVSNKYNIVTGGFSSVLSIHNTSLASPSQYVKLLMGTHLISYPSIALRFTDSSSPYYLVTVDGSTGTTYWEYCPSVGGSNSEIANGALGGGLADGSSTVGVTIDGAGTSTVLRLWRNPTANAPTTAALWDGAGPALSFTTDPATPVDTGNQVGIGGAQGTSNNMKYAGFWAGDFGGAPPAANDAYLTMPPMAAPRR